MNSKRKIFLSFLLLGIFGIAALFFHRYFGQTSHQNEVSTPPAIASILTEGAGRVGHDGSLHRNHLRTDTPPSIETDFVDVFHVEDHSYEGTQTVQGLLEMFQEMAADAVLDERYPQEEWIERVLAQGYTIDGWEDYAGFLTARRNLIGLEDTPEVWASGRLGIPPTDDFETYQAAYMDRKIWEYAQLKDAKLADPQVNGGFFKDDGTFFPFAPQRVYIERNGTGAAFMGATLSDTQKFELLTQGVIPEGYEVIYTNSEGTPLAEPPPLLSRESVLANFHTKSLDQAWDAASQLDDFSFAASESDYQAAEYTPAPSADAAARAFAAEKQAHNAVVDGLRALDALDAGEYDGFTDDADIEAELQKLFTAEGSAKNGIDSENHGGFSPERLNRAMNTLKRYGPKEGIERIRAEDPNIAAQIENRN